MKQSWMIALVLVIAAVSFEAYGKGGCQEKRKAMHTARVALKDCNKAWGDSIRGDAADPGDDCSSKQTGFIAAVKEMKACIKEEKSKK
jgi:hypothetical protein